MARSTVSVQRIELGAREGDVAQRPETLVRQTVAIAFFLFFAEPDAPQRVARIFRRNADVVALWLEERSMVAGL